MKVILCVTWSFLFFLTSTDAGLNGGSKLLNPSKLFVVKNSPMKLPLLRHYKDKKSMLTMFL